MWIEGATRAGSEPLYVPTLSRLRRNHYQAAVVWCASRLQMWSR